MALAPGGHGDGGIERADEADLHRLQVGRLGQRRGPGPVYSSWVRKWVLNGSTWWNGSSSLTVWAYSSSVFSGSFGRLVGVERIDLLEQLGCGLGIDRRRVGARGASAARRRRAADAARRTCERTNGTSQVTMSMIAWRTIASHRLRGRRRSRPA